MQVAAKCIMAAFDNTTTQHFKPGQGPLPGGLYEIDRDGPLAKLKTAGGAKGKYVFEFDRNAGPADKPHDYTCKDCGKKFKTLPALGTHTREEHNTLRDDEIDHEEAVRPEDGRKKPKEYACKHEGCDKSYTNLYHYSQHLKMAHPKVEADLITA